MRLRTGVILAAIVFGTAFAVSPALASTCPWLPTWGNDDKYATTTTEEIARNCDAVYSPDVEEPVWPECQTVTTTVAAQTTTTPTTTTPTSTTTPTTTTTPTSTTLPATTTVPPSTVGPVVPPVTTTVTTTQTTTALTTTTRTVTTAKPTPKRDACPNLRGVQTKVPKGKIKRGGRCIAKPTIKPRVLGRSAAEGKQSVCIVNGRAVRPCVRGKG